MDRAPIVFPIRFAAGDTAVQTTTRELSERGVLVRCLEPPASGTTLSMKLYLPGARDALDVEGVVREHANAGEEPGFWAEFVGAGDGHRAQIVEVIARRARAADAVPIGAMALHPHEDPRRAFPRYNANFAVRFATVTDFVLEYAANISAGGIFVHTENPPPLKTIVQVEMELPGSGSAVPARGIVVHRVTKEDAKKRGTLPGVGVQFMDADDEFRRRIDAAIAHILETERRS
jgi:type IV pilus assembly protein PilZ